MNCPECGHPVAEHSRRTAGCTLCLCLKDPSDIELHYWRAEALAAREYAAAVQIFLSNIRVDNYLGEQMLETRHIYLAARVFNTPQETP